LWSWSELDQELVVCDCIILILIECSVSKG